MDNYNTAAYNVRRAVKEAKRDYGKKVELQFQEGNPRSLWQGLRTMTDYKPTPLLVKCWCVSSSLALALRPSAANKLKQRLMDGWVNLPHRSPFLSMTSGESDQMVSVGGSSNFHNDIQPVPDSVCHTSLPRTLDPLQFAYRLNGSTEDAIAHILHITLSYLDKRGSSVRGRFSI